MKEIPKTGRIGRFAKIIEKKANQQTFEKIMESSPEYVPVRQKKAK